MVKAATIFASFGVAARGEEDAAVLYQAVGDALTRWEASEDTMTGLFGTIVRPDYAQPAVRMAYLSIPAPSARRGMILAAASVFFRFFPSKELAGELKSLMDAYQEGASRRNEIAHGIVAGHVLPACPEFTGYYVGPHAISSRKRGDKNAPLYLLSAAEIGIFIRDIGTLEGRARLLSASLRERWQSASEAARRRY